MLKRNIFASYCSLFAFNNCTRTELPVYTFWAMNRCCFFILLHLFCRTKAQHAHCNVLYISFSICLCFLIGTIKVGLIKNAKTLRSTKAKWIVRFRNCAYAHALYIHLDSISSTIFGPNWECARWCCTIFQYSCFTLLMRSLNFMHNVNSCQNGGKNCGAHNTKEKP